MHLPWRCLRDEEMLSNERILLIGHWVMRCYNQFDWSRMNCNTRCWLVELSNLQCWGSESTKHVGQIQYSKCIVWEIVPEIVAVYIVIPVWRNYSRHVGWMGVVAEWGYMGLKFHPFSRGLLNGAEWGWMDRTRILFSPIQFLLYSLIHQVINLFLI